MSKTLIVYYSRTGTTQKLAKELAGALDADSAEIRCTRYDGWLRYLLAGYDSVKGNLPPIDVPQVALDGYDLVLLGAPIWTSHPALPLRSFLAGKPALPAHVGLFLTYGGQSAPEIAVGETQELLSSPLVASLSLKHAEVDGGRISQALNVFLERLRN